MERFILLEYSCTFTCVGFDLSLLPLLGGQWVGFKRKKMTRCWRLGLAFLFCLFEHMAVETKGIIPGRRERQL